MEEDVDIGIAQTNSDNILIVGRGEEVGRFWFEDGKLMFKGDPDKSAEMFLESLMKLAND